MKKKFFKIIIVFGFSVKVFFHNMEDEHCHEEMIQADPVTGKVSSYQISGGTNVNIYTVKKAS
jgi:hypothetical protein